MDKQLQQARSARKAAGWTTAIVMSAGTIYGFITGDDTLYFIIFFGFGTLGMVWWIWLDDQVTKLEVVEAYKRRDPTKDQGAPPPQPQPSAATDPTVVVAVIGLIGTILVALLSR